MLCVRFKVEAMVQAGQVQVQIQFQAQVLIYQINQKGAKHGFHPGLALFFGLILI